MTPHATAPDVDSGPAPIDPVQAPTPVLFLTHYDRIGAPSRYRCYQYFPRLVPAGVTPAVHFIQSERMYQMKERRQSKALFGFLVLLAYLRRMALLLVRGRRYPVWFVEKEIFPFLPWWIERLFIGRRVRVLVDYDDAVFLKYERGSRLLSWLCGRKIARLMRRADVVLSGNEYISEYAARAGAREVRWLPSVVDETKYRIRDGGTARGVPVIGWMGGYRNSHHILSIAPALVRLRQQTPFVLRIVGGGRIPLPDALDVDYRPWSEEREVDDIREFAVGIMPLVDGDWEKGKCGLKLIQYLAAGVPVVATPIGINARIVQPGVNGFLATSEDEWLQGLSRLVAEPGAFPAERCVATIAEHFTLAAQAPAVLAAIRGGRG